ncbi:MAG: SLC13 family permease [Phycisphaerales bacterium]
MLAIAQMTILTMPWQGWFTLGVIGLVMGALMTNRINTDVAMVGGLTLLMVCGIVDPVDAVRGFAHPAVLIIGAMFVVAAGLEETGGMEMLAHRLLGRPKSLPGAQLRLMAPVSFMSACMNTTPIVAIYLPILSDWTKKLRISPSKLFLPLSYAAIFGGLCTMIGTSSNITLNELYLSELERAQAAGEGWLSTFGLSPQRQLNHQFYWMAGIGVPAVIVGTLFVILTSRWLLPIRKPALASLDDRRQYSVEMMIEPGSPIVGKTIEAAGLRHLPGLFLTEIERRGETMMAVGPGTTLEAEDRLSFAGVLDSVVDLRKIRGLVPATDQVHKVEGPAAGRQTVEAVVSHGSPLVGRTVRETRFRTTYNAAIVAVARKGHQIDRKIGDIRLQPGDTLLLVAHSGFVEAHRNGDDFYLVSAVEGARQIRHERAWLSLTILGLLIVMLAVQPFGLHPLASAFFAAMLMIGTRCVTGTVARASIHWNILAVIGAAIGIGEAMKATNAAEAIATSMLNVVGGFGPHAVLFIIFLLTSVFAQFVTNNGAAVLMFPITMLTVKGMDVNPEPFVLTLIIAAGTNLMTPISYQTNLMVYGPGGYRFSDFLRLGVPITLLFAGLTTFIAPLMFPFE